jgi:hypothetical protein
LLIRKRKSFENNKISDESKFISIKRDREEIESKIKIKINITLLYKLKYNKSYKNSNRKI